MLDQLVLDQQVERVQAPRPDDKLADILFEFAWICLNSIAILAISWVLFSHLKNFGSIHIYTVQIVRLYCSCC